jgi:leucyl-tRNA synthetase
VTTQPWPNFDPALCIDDSVEVAVQVNGKLRGKLTVARDLPQDQLTALAMAEPNVAKWLEGKEIVKIIAVPGKMVSIVIKG